MPINGPAAITNHTYAVARGESDTPAPKWAAPCAAAAAACIQTVIVIALLMILTPDAVDGVNCLLRTTRRRHQDISILWCSFAQTNSPT
jgi:hypothetical protein